MPQPYQQKASVSSQSLYPTAHPVEHDRGKENSNPCVPAAAAWGSAMDTAAARSHDQRIFQLAVPIIQILGLLVLGLGWPRCHGHTLNSHSVGRRRGIM